MFLLLHEPKSSVLPPGGESRVLFHTEALQSVDSKPSADSQQHLNLKHLNFTLCFWFIAEDFFYLKMTCEDP